MRSKSPMACPALVCGFGIVAKRHHEAPALSSGPWVPLCVAHDEHGQVRWLGVFELGGLRLCEFDSDHSAHLHFPPIFHVEFRGIGSWNIFLFHQSLRDSWNVENGKCALNIKPPVLLCEKISVFLDLVVCGRLRESVWVYQPVDNLAPG